MLYRDNVGRRRETNGHGALSPAKASIFATLIALKTNSSDKDTFDKPKLSKSTKK
jgi:hypothetical protein